MDMESPPSSAALIINHSHEVDVNLYVKSQRHRLGARTPSSINAAFLLHSDYALDRLTQVFSRGAVQRNSRIDSVPNFVAIVVHEFRVKFGERAAHPAGSPRDNGGMNRVAIDPTCLLHAHGEREPRFKCIPWYSLIAYPSRHKRFESDGAKIYTLGASMHQAQSEWRQMNSPEEVINEIRLEFGYNERDRTPTTRLVRNLSNVLNIVSTELYNYGGHFIVELIQNADDNKYSPNVAPMLDISIDENGIVVQNNEVGFTTENVQAICNVGESTKRDRKEEATGEKGVGFKAVFSVSMRPEIHSNGFHFCFDRTAYGNVGMIVPEWLPEAKHRKLHGNTIIFLPSDKSLSIPKDLPQQLEPELLLFLRCLRFIKISDARAGTTVELRRTDQGALTTIQRVVTTNGKTVTSNHQFFRHERQTDVSDIHEPKRQGIKCTAVVVAIPLEGAGVASCSTSRKLFAFLPVKDSELSLVVHADFILNASREDLVMDRTWNIRLRDALGSALAEAVIAMQQAEPEGYTALRVLRDPKEIINPFIRVVMERAIADLKQSNCIPGNDSLWLNPANAIRADERGLSELLDEAAVRTELGKAYVSKSAKQIEPALNVLGVEQFTFGSLLKIISRQDWLAKQPIPWLIKLYAKLAPFAKSPHNLAKIKEIPLFRLSNGLQVSAATKFYRSLKGNREYGFERELLVLSTGLIPSKADKSSVTEVASLMDLLGIHDADPVTIIDEHILPQQSKEEIDCQIVIAHAHFVLDNYKLYKEAKKSHADPLSELRNKFHLLAGDTDGDTRDLALPSELYLGRAFGDRNDMEGMFDENITQFTIARDYLLCHSPPNPEKWREFFLALGANEMPRLHLVGSDYQLSPELEELIKRNDPQRNRRLFVLLETYFDSWTKARLERGRSVSTTLCEALQEFVVDVTNGEARPAREVFLENKDNRAVFGSSAPYLAWKVKNEEFAGMIGIVCRPTVEKVLIQLEKLSKSGAQALTEIVPLYQFLVLQSSVEATQIRSAFAIKPIVFSKVHGRSELKSSSLRNCCWFIPPPLQQYCSVISLRQDWGDFNEFFRHHLQIKPGLDGKELVDVISKIAQANLDSKLAGDTVRLVYEQLGALIARNADKPQNSLSWVVAARSARTMFTSRGDWCLPTSDVYEADDEKLAAIFQDSDKVRFLAIPNDQLPKFRRLIDALGVNKVTTAATKIPPDRDTGDTESALQARVRGRWHHIVRIAYANHYEGYERAKKGGQLIQIRDMEVRIHRPLLMDVSIAKEIRAHRFPTHLYEHHGRACLLVDGDEQSSWIYISESIASYLNVSSSCANLIAMVLNAKDESEVARIFKQKNCNQLPENELNSLNLPLTPEDEEWESPQDFAAGDHPNPATSKPKNPITPPSKVAGESSPSSPRGHQPNSPRPTGSGKSPADAPIAIAPPTTPDGASSRQQSAPRKQSRLISYVATDAEGGSNTPAESQQEQRDQTDDAAIKFVVEHEKAAGRIPKVMEHSNPGFDIESADPQVNNPIFIEVKGITDEWAERGVTLSRTQFDYARIHKENAWLYVVEYALDSRRRRLWRIKDPATKCNKFGFDHGWRGICEEGTKVLKLESVIQEGEPYPLEGGSMGVITRVTARGALYTVVARRDDGVEVERTGSLEMHHRAIGGGHGESSSNS